MNLKEVKEFVRYQEIVDKYKRKGVLTNDYIYQEVADLIIHNNLFEYCGINNAFLFVKKDECLRLYYYLNDLEEIHDFDINDNLVVEIIFLVIFRFFHAKIDLSVTDIGIKSNS